MELDMENFQSITIVIIGGGQVTSWAVYQSDIPSGTLGYVLPLNCINSTLASKVPDTIRSTNGTIILQGNKGGRFVKIIKIAGPSDATLASQLIAILNQEPVTLDKLDVFSKPSALVNYSSPVAIPDSNPIPMFTATSANVFCNISQIKLTNSGTAPAEVRIIANGVIVFRTIVAAMASITENLQIPLITFGNQPFNISVANSVNTSVFAYVSAYYSLN